MKSLNSLVVASSLLLGFVPASAVFAQPHFTPPGSFSGTGSISMQTAATFQQTIKCNIRVNGSTNPVNTTSITSVSFSGSSPFCQIMVAQNLPWEISMNSPLSGLILDAGFSMTTAACGIHSINIQWFNGNSSLSVFSQSLGSNCKLLNLDIQMLPMMVVIN